MASTKSEMSFLGHLEELRWRIIKSVLTVIAFAIPCGIFWQKIFDVVMIHPLRFANPRPLLIVTNPVEAVMLSFKIAIAGGVICAVPVIIYQVWRFVAPGLYKKEKVIILPTVIASTVFFLMGVGFCYAVLPYMVQFLSQFSQGRLESMFRINEYMNFLIQLTMAFGVVFQLPVASFVLSRMGVISPKFLVKYSRHAILIIFVVAAILSPPDVLSQCILAAPLLVLYGVSILVSQLSQRKP